MISGLNAPVMKKVAFFVGLSDNMGPVTEHTDIMFDRVITNVGSGFETFFMKYPPPQKKNKKKQQQQLNVEVRVLVLWKKIEKSLSLQSLFSTL